MNQRHREILLEVGALPTAPFVEDMVGGYIRRFVRSRGHLSLKADRWGNLLVRYARGGARGRGGPLWVAAHVDHPGFVADRMSGRKKLRARWFGGVGLDFFKNADVRFYVMARDGAQAEGHCRVERIVPGRVTSVVTARRNGEARPHLRRRVSAAYLEVAEPVPPGSPGMWYLPDPRVVRGQVLARAHDDLAQVAAMLCLLDELDRRKVPGRVTCAFTRAEEVGFVGAIGLVGSGAVSPNSTFISLESSDARAAGVNLGDGPVLRVGDLATTFDQATLSWMQQVAKDLAAGDRGFGFQRKLMPGGTCEATPLAVFGFRTGAMCLPLLNYHNMGAGKHIEPEVIDLGDFENEVTWLTALVERAGERATVNKGLARRFRKRFDEHRGMLKKWSR